MPPDHARQFTIERLKVRRPVPKTAEVTLRDGERVATWTTATGPKAAPVVEHKGKLWIVWQRETYVIHYTDVAGRVRHVHTGTTSLAKAEKVRDRLAARVLKQIAAREKQKAEIKAGLQAEKEQLKKTLGKLQHDAARSRVEQAEAMRRQAEEIQQSTQADDAADVVALQTLLTVYATHRPVSAGYFYQLNRTASLFDEWLTRRSTTGDLDDTTVSRWLQALEATHARRTVAGHRGNILQVWRFAARRGLCNAPGEVRRCPKPAPQPVAWTTEEFRRLLKAADEMGPRPREYFLALLPAAYESGLRRGDLFALERHNIQPSGQIDVRQHKTGVPHTVSVRPETAARILALPGNNPQKPPWNLKHYGSLWNRLRKAAGFDSGACQKLRRTGATYVAAKHGRDAARVFLGHKTPQMVDHYIDPRIASPPVFRPPAVDIV